MRARRSDQDRHLKSPGQYRNDVPFQRRLDAFFIKTEDKPALERLEELAKEFFIGGARPYIAIRAASGDRGRVIVVRHSDSGDEESTGISAGNMTKAEAAEHPGAQAALARFAEDKLFELRIQNAPATVTYSSAIVRFMATRDPNSGDAVTDRRRRESNKHRNVRDPQDLFDAMKARSKVLIAEFFKGRTLKRAPTLLPTEIKRFLVKKCLKAGATMDKHGQVAGALDSNVAVYVSLVRQTCDWLKDTYHPPIALSMATFIPKTTRSDALKWSECRNVMIWAQGYVWEDGGFARHWVKRDGTRRLEYKKLSDPQLSKHRAEFLPLLRFVPSLAMTGSRTTVGSLLRWTEDDYFGHVELDGKRSRIHRTGTYGPSYVNKPRETSSLTPLARGFFEVCHAKDLREAAKRGWTVDRVIHNGRGGPVPDLSGLFKRACDALGIKNSARKLKHLAVTMHWFAGFELRRIGLIVGTDPKTTEDKYLYLEEEYAGLMRPRPEPEKMTFADFADPSRDMAKIPRAPAPPRPTAALRTPRPQEAVLA